MLLLKRLLSALPLLLVSPVLMAVSFVALLLTDIVRKMGPGAGGRGPGASEFAPGLAPGLRLHPRRYGRTGNRRTVPRPPAPPPS